MSASVWRLLVSVVLVVMVTVFMCHGAVKIKVFNVKEESPHYGFVMILPQWATRDHFSCIDISMCCNVYLSACLHLQCFAVVFWRAWANKSESRSSELMFLCRRRARNQKTCLKFLTWIFAYCEKKALRFIIFNVFILRHGWWNGRVPSLVAQPFKSGTLNEGIGHCEALIPHF